MVILLLGMFLVIIVLVVVIVLLLMVIGVINMVFDLIKVFWLIVVLCLKMLL